MRLPDYLPPNAQRACVAAGLSPLLVLAAFALTVLRAMEADTALAVCTACVIWVAYEMTVFQRGVDHYSRDYVRRHLAGRCPDSLRACVSADGAHAPTREFVLGFLDAPADARHAVASGPRRG